MSVVVAHKQGATLKCMARVLVSGAEGVIADFSSITYKTYLHNPGAADTQTDSGTLTIAFVVFNTPVLSTVDEDWESATEGYNFMFSAPAAGFAGEGYHEVVVSYTLTTGEVGKISFDARVVHTP